jgi:hypothetical protein
MLERSRDEEKRPTRQTRAPEHWGANFTLLLAGMREHRHCEANAKSCNEHARLTQHFSQGCDFSKSCSPALGRRNFITPHGAGIHDKQKRAKSKKKGRVPGRRIKNVGQRPRFKQLAPLSSTGPRPAGSSPWGVKRCPPRSSCQPSSSHRPSP